MGSSTPTPDVPAADGTGNRGTVRSCFRLTAQRLAAVSIIALAGSAGMGPVVSASEPSGPEVGPGHPHEVLAAAQKATIAHPDEMRISELEPPTWPLSEVEGEQSERASGAEPAHTGSDSALPLVGAALVAAGGLVAGLSILARRARISPF